MWIFNYQCSTYYCNLRFNIFVALILILESIVLSGIILSLTADHSENSKYVLYIGLNDKDTCSQIIPTEEAKEIVNGICVKYAEGYTVTEANGGWIDEAGALTEEVSLVYTITNAEEADVVSIMDEVLTALNQNSILVERQEISYTYYSGN